MQQEFRLEKLGLKTDKKEAYMKAHKVNLHDVIGYLIIIPFLNPRGFYEVLPIYKTLMTGWMYLALLMVLFEIFTQFKGTIIYMKKKGRGIVFCILCCYDSNYVNCSGRIA